MMSMSKSTDDGLGLREFVQCPARSSGTKYRLAPLGNHCLLARCKRHVLLCGGAFTWIQNELLLETPYLINELPCSEFAERTQSHMFAENGLAEKKHTARNKNKKQLDVISGLQQGFELCSIPKTQYIW